jgi:hypothetical protein
MTRKHYTTIDASTVLTLTLDEIFVMAQAARFDDDTRNENKLMAAFHLVTVRNHYATATTAGNELMMVSTAGYIAEYTKVFNYLWSTEPTPTPTEPTEPTYTAVGLPVMVQDGPCDVAECNGVEISSSVATSHRDMVAKWCNDFDIATHNHNIYHITTTDITNDETMQWLTQRYFGLSHSWTLTQFDDVNPATRATIWAGDMADKLTTAGIDLATLATPEDVHCAIAQWLVDVDGCNPYDVDGMFVSMMIGNHSPADVSDKVIEDWYQRWVVLNREAIDNGTCQPATPTHTTPATVDHTTNIVACNAMNRARMAHTDNDKDSFKYHVWHIAQRAIENGESEEQVYRTVMKWVEEVVAGTIDSVYEAIDELNA